MEDQLIDAMLELNEDLVLELVSQRVAAGEDPLTIIRTIQKGVIGVGDYYDQGKYFIADLIMSGLIFKEVVKLLEFPLTGAGDENAVRTIFATVEKDIHDIGKNIAVTYFNSKGVHPIDLGVNVPPETILEQVKDGEETVLFLSGLITSSYYSMRQTIELLKENNLKDRVTVIICGLVDDEVKTFVGADFFVKDVVESFDVYMALAQAMHEKNQK